MHCQPTSDQDVRQEARGHCLLSIYLCLGGDHHHVRCSVDQNLWCFASRNRECALMQQQRKRRRHADLFRRRRRREEADDNDDDEEGDLCEVFSVYVHVFLNTHVLDIIQCNAVSHCSLQILKFRILTSKRALDLFPKLLDQNSS